MHLLGGKMKARLQAFDSIVEKNAQALANPQVAQVLGVYATTLKQNQPTIVFAKRPRNVNTVTKRTSSR